ncbi:MAG: hypothetical protein ACOC0B_00865 [bacterium]
MGESAHDQYAVYRATIIGHRKPQPRDERVYFNFWRYEGKELQGTDREQVIITDFHFAPAD